MVKEKSAEPKVSERRENKRKESEDPTKGSTEPKKKRAKLTSKPDAKKAGQTESKGSANKEAKKKEPEKPGKLKKTNI